MKLVILGCSGSGKSTLARNLGKDLDISVFHMDQLYWKNNWKESSDEEVREKLEKILALENWIIDGNYSRFLPERLERADEIVYIQLPRWQNLWRVTKRYWKYRGKTRPDMGEGCQEKLDWDFFVWIWKFQKRSHPATMKLIEGSGKSYTILSSQKELDFYLQEGIQEYSNQ